MIREQEIEMKFLQKIQAFIKWVKCPYTIKDILIIHSAMIHYYNLYEQIEKDMDTLSAGYHTIPTKELSDNQIQAYNIAMDKLIKTSDHYTLQMLRLSKELQKYGIRIPTDDEHLEPTSVSNIILARKEKVDILDEINS